MENAKNHTELIMGPLDADMEPVEQVAAQMDQEALDAHDEISAVDRHWQIAIHLWPALKSLGHTTGHLLAAGVDADMLAGRPPHPHYPRDPHRHLTFHTPIPDAGSWPHWDLPVLELDSSRGDPRRYDLVLVNLPYHDVALIDTDRRTRLGTYHRELLVSALDQTAPGGLTIALTSPVFLDHPDPDLRNAVSDRADLVGAVRLPVGAMRPDSHAYSPTDVLLLHRRPPDEPGPGIPVAREVATDWGRGHLSEYWLDHPDHMLGLLGASQQVGMLTVRAGLEPLGRLLQVAFDQIATTTPTSGATGSRNEPSPAPAPAPNRASASGPGPVDAPGL